MTTTTRTEFEAAALPPVPTLTDEERQWLHYNPNTQDLVDFVQGHAVAYAKLAISAHAAQTERERFEAAAYRWLREQLSVHLIGDKSDFILSNTMLPNEADTAIAAAMGWPTVPEKES